ncbi:MAG TPA: UDP-N-acetylglucosamine 2-epimerase (non-hydrolyzing) [Terriglobales bacterium]|nr:UDP-N-acetylglucosamine 2-epimerase (non-hydrolyzing) [Terriglobales bacterium]
MIKKILLVAGARPNFMKIAPLMRVLAREPDFLPLLVHTGQHFSSEMSAIFFRDLEIPEPIANLAAGAGSHSRQTAEIMSRFEPVLLDTRPDCVVVVGDVNSTLACALVAKKLQYPVAHIEAGLRSFDRRMPEEINRLATDAVSDLFFTTEASANDNLRREGVPDDRVHFVGNIMIDSLLACRALSSQSSILEKLALAPGQYAVLTLHRPENVDQPAPLLELWLALIHIATEMPLVFPVHPRTRHALGKLGLDHPRVRFVEPMGYLDFVQLLASARAVLTDSGGIQEETTVLQIPCLTLRDNTERPITLTHGTNRLAGTSAAGIVRAWEQAIRQPVSPATPPPLWDGKAALRIADVLRG